MLVEISFDIIVCDQVHTFIIAENVKEFDAAFDVYQLLKDLELSPDRRKDVLLKHLGGTHLLHTLEGLHRIELVSHEIDDPDHAGVEDPA